MLYSFCSQRCSCVPTDSCFCGDASSPRMQHINCLFLTKQHRKQFFQVVTDERCPKEFSFSEASLMHLFAVLGCAICKRSQSAGANTFTKALWRTTWFWSHWILGKLKVLTIWFQLFFHVRMSYYFESKNLSSRESKQKIKDVAEIRAINITSCDKTRYEYGESRIFNIFISKGDLNICVIM